MANDEGTQAPKRGILKSVLTWLRNYFVFVGVLATILPILLGVALVRLAKESSGAAPKKSLLSDKTPVRLVFDLRTPLAEAETNFTQSVINRLIGAESPLYLPDIRSALRRAADDARVARLELNITDLSGSLAEISELRRAIVDFKAKGKPVHVVLHDASDWAYYVASAADTVILNPASSMTLTGPIFSLMYFGEALKKIGVDIHVIRAGKYKSAFEPFVADQPSEATLEQYRSMNKSLITHIVEEVAKGRKKTPAEVGGWYKRSIFSAAEALAMGMVDKLGYGVDDVLTAREVKEEPGLTLKEYRTATASEPGKQESVDDQGGVALIEAVGEIRMSNPDGGDGVIVPGDIKKRAEWAIREEDVKAVVLRISSPGGSAVASEMIWNEIKMLADSKPLIVSMGAYAASGGYYIAAPARRIFAEPTTVTGSIGVIGMLPSAGAFKEKYGVSFYAVTESERKAMVDLGQKPSDEDLRLLDKVILETYDTFKQRVAAGRNMQLPDVEALAQGRVYTALEAKELGLVDEIGGMQAAFNAAKELAGFDVNKLYPVLRFEDEEEGLAECLASPSDFLRCLGEQSSTLGAQRHDSIFARQGADRVARYVEGWLETARKERALMIWPQYLGLAVR